MVSMYFIQASRFDMGQSLTGIQIMGFRIGVYGVSKLLQNIHFNEMHRSSNTLNTRDSSIFVIVFMKRHFDKNVQKGSVLQK